MYLCWEGIINIDIALFVLDEGFRLDLARLQLKKLKKKIDGQYINSVPTIQYNMAAIPSTPAPYMAHAVEMDTPWKGFHPGNHHFEDIQPIKLEDAFEVVKNPVMASKKRHGVSKKRASTPPNQGIPKRKTPPPLRKKRSMKPHGGFGNAAASRELFP